MILGKSDTAISLFLNGCVYVVEQQSHPYYEEIIQAVQEGRAYEHLVDVGKFDAAKNAMAKLRESMEKKNG